LIVANAKLQIFGDLPKGLSPFLLAQLNFLSDTNNSKSKKNIEIFLKKTSLLNPWVNYSGIVAAKKSTAVVSTCVVSNLRKQKEKKG
jgi:hypothetical protein